MSENKEQKPKRSLVTGEKIKSKSLSKIKREHKERDKADKKEQKKLNKKINKMEKKFAKQEISVEATTLSKSEIDYIQDMSAVNQESVSGDVEIKKVEQEKVLIVRRADKSKPATKGQKIRSFISYVLVGLVAVFFGYFAGNFYVANVLNAYDPSQYNEEFLRDDASAIYQQISTSAKQLDQYTAIELFVGAEYLLGVQDKYYATVVGEIKPDIAGAQSIWGYKSKNGDIYDCENVSKGMVSVAEKYTWDIASQTAKVYQATKITTVAEYSETPTWTMNLEQYKQEYGTAPDSPCVPYIISSKTLSLGSDKVTRNGDGTFTITFKLDPKLSVANYVKQMKHMAALPSYPSFKEITVTATLDSNLQFVKLRYDESYAVNYGIMANCIGFVEYGFTY